MQEKPYKDDTTVNAGGGLNGAVAKEHLEMLLASRIDPQLVAERGYRSTRAGDRRAVEEIGFSPRQATVAAKAGALLIPLWSVTGEQRGWTMRPNEPRVDKRRGKPRKYEFPAGSRQMLDVPPRCLAQIKDPSVVLWITEGAKKADALASLGLCALDLVGVWNWRGRNNQGGLTALADWELVALKGREVVVAFDSDAVRKQPVYLALQRLSRFLKLRGAKVRWLVLPDKADGSKAGVDDWLAEDPKRGVAELEALVQSQIPEPQYDTEEILERVDSGEYRVTVKPKGVWLESLRNTAEGPEWVRKQIFQGVMRPTELLVYHDEVGGTEDWVRLRRETVEPKEVLVPLEDLGGHTKAIVLKISNGECSPAPHATTGEIQHTLMTLLKDTRSIHVIRSTGWKTIAGVRFYAHGGGTIPALPEELPVRVEPEYPLERMRLPEPPDKAQLTQDIMFLPELFSVFSPSIATALIAAVARAPIGEVTWSVVLVGPSGVGKSTAAALAQSFWTGDADTRRPLCTFESTPNAIARLQHFAADALIVVDDWVGQGPNDQRALEAIDRVVRGVGNQGGRARLTSKLRTVPPERPRALTVVTAEQLPTRESLLARAIVVPVEKGSVKLGKELEALQLEAAGEGVFARIAAAWISHLATVDLAAMRKELEKARAAEPVDAHPRVQRNLAELWASYRAFVQYFARELDLPDLAELMERYGREGVRMLAASSKQVINLASPAERFIEGVASLVASGAVVLPDPKEIYEGKAKVIGWHARESEEVWLLPDEACRAVVELWRGAGVTLNLERLALSRELAGRGYVKRDGRNATVKRQVGGQSLRVWALPAKLIFGEEEEQQSLI